MRKVTNVELEKIKKMVKKEFPKDTALQQVHIARKIIAKEAERKGLSFFEYVKSLRRQAKNARQEQGA